MKISICPTQYSATHLFTDCDENSDFNYLARRLTRTATLDGECVIADNGFSASDGTIKIVITPSLNSLDTFRAAVELIKSFGMMTIANREGIFLAAIETITNRKTELNITFLIKKQLA